MATPVTLILRTIGVDSLTANPVLHNENTIVDKVGNSKVNRAKVGIKTVKSKSKNLVKPFLAKSQPFTQSSRSDFVTLKVL